MELGTSAIQRMNITEQNVTKYDQKNIIKRFYISVRICLSNRMNTPLSIVLVCAKIYKLYLFSVARNKMRINKKTYSKSNMTTWRPSISIL